MRTIRHPAGFTLIEVIVSTVLVGVVLVAAMDTLSGSIRNLRATIEPNDAYALLTTMAAEVNAVAYEDPDGNSSGLGIEADESASPTNRLGFDDVDDFAGYSVTPPQYRDGSEVSGMTGWTQAFTVSYRDGDTTSGLPGSIANDEGVKRFRVRLTSPDGIDYDMHGLRTPYGTPEEPAPFDATRVAAVLVELTVGDAARLDSAAGVENLAETP